MTTLDRATVDALLSTTRAVRKRLDLDRPVERDVILECIRLAIQAPTGSNLQRWRWMVVTDADKRRRVGEIYMRAMEPYMGAMTAGIEKADDQTRRVVDSTRHLIDVMGRVPVQLIPCQLGRPDEAVALFQAMGFENDDMNFAASGFYGSAWPAAWSFMLAARSRGLGTAITTMHLAYEREVGELLGIPDSVAQLGLIPVAYYKGETFRPARRRPPEEITYFDTWKEF